MKKMMIISVIVLLLILVIAAAILTAPVGLYFSIVEDGCDSKYLSFPPVSKNFIRGSEFKLQEIKKIFNDHFLWKNLHFVDYILPFPLHHPKLLVIPIIGEGSEGPGPKIGARFIDHQRNELVSFKVNESKKFSRKIENQKLFTLPFFRKNIIEKDSDVIWRDIFTIDLETPFSKEGVAGRNWMVFLEDWRELAIKKLSYFLFIYNMRLDLFENDIGPFSFFSEQKIGIVELKEADERFLKEMIFLKEDGLLHSITIRTRKWDQFAFSIRRRIINSIQYRKSSRDSSDIVYQQYKKLEYKKRIDQEGMIYLFIAWSHNMENAAFLREMIQFLERGKRNLYQLGPLYQYAFKKFGINFAKRPAPPKEKSDEYLTRKISEELENEVDKARKKKLLEYDGNFKDSEDKSKFFLQKAKIEKINIDQEDDILESD